MNYAVDDGTIVFRTRLGAKLNGLRAAGLSEALCSFQVDAVDPFHRIGWSVLVQGIASEATAAEMAHVRLSSWAGPGDRWVRLVPQKITGRRLIAPDHGRDGRSYL